MAVIRNDKKFFLMTDLGLSHFRCAGTSVLELFYILNPVPKSSPMCPSQPEKMVSRRHFPKQMSV